MLNWCSWREDIVRVVWCGTILLFMAAPIWAQSTFSSGSTGADGVLRPLEDIVIDMNEKPDGIWHYTTINIPAGITVSFTPNTANTPVVWLASSGVTIAGTINLNGSAGSNVLGPGNETPGGPGGFRGGLTVLTPQFGDNLVAATPGEGPGGGAAGTVGTCGSGGGYGTAGGGEEGGQTYGDRLVRLLIGGSGGGGVVAASTSTLNGGGGGGAILIASSETITLESAIITADGGTVAPFSFLAESGAGAGGSIRLVANRIAGTGTLQANGGGGGNRVCASANVGGVGRIRLEAFFINGISATPPAALGPPLSVGLPSPAIGTIRIIDVAGEVVPNPPAGSTITPDVTFAEAGDITINLATNDIPTGTPLTVRVTTGEQRIEVQSTPTDVAGNATAVVTVPAGIGNIQAFAAYDLRP